MKDIIAVPQYKTTWGSRSFKDQVLDTEAWVYKRYSKTFVLVCNFFSWGLFSTHGLQLLGLFNRCKYINLFFWCGRLKSAGAVLVAKLVTGSLAYDDIWFGGRTRNPWNIEEFTTGSSAGPAACTSAGYLQLEARLHHCPPFLIWNFGPI